MTRCQTAGMRLSERRLTPALCVYLSISPSPQIATCRRAHQQPHKLRMTSLFDVLATAGLVSTNWTISRVWVNQDSFVLPLLLSFSAFLYSSVLLAHTHRVTYTHTPSQNTYAYINSHVHTYIHIYIHIYIYK